MFDEINTDKIIRKFLTNTARINHCISTANFMKKYANLFNINEKQAYYAGLLHDLAKEMSNKKILKLADSFFRRNIVNINYYNYKKKHPGLMHGVAAAEILFKKYKINNLEILESVCYHTCGGSNITDLSIFTFVSDFCEPFRENQNSKNVYNIIVKENNLYKANLYTYIYLIKRLLQKQKVIVQDSLDGYNFALSLYKNTI